MEINNASNNPTVVEETPKILVKKGEFGQLLRDARNERQLTLEKVSQEIYIKERQLIALEEEDFDSLPQMTFARGFAIKYAQYLQIDEKEIAEKFDAIYPDRLKVNNVNDIDLPMSSMGKLHRSSHRKFSINPILLLACIAVFAFAVFLIYIVSTAEEEQNQPVVVEEGIVNGSEQQQGASLDEVGATGSTLNLDKQEQDKEDNE